MKRANGADTYGCPGRELHVVRAPLSGKLCWSGDLELKRHGAGGKTAARFAQLVHVKRVLNFARLDTLEKHICLCQS